MQLFSAFEKFRKVTISHNDCLSVLMGTTCIPAFSVATVALSAVLIYLIKEIYIQYQTLPIQLKKN
jgi:hypothetical protein